MISLPAMGGHSAVQGHSADDQAKSSFSITEVATGLYMLEGDGRYTSGNVALSIGDDGVIMIDDSSLPMIDALKSAIATVTDKPIDFLINTHSHRDHTGNNYALDKMGAKIFSHENTRKRLVAARAGPSKTGLPIVTFSQQMHFYLNSNDTHLIHVSKAHTDGDIIIYFKNLNVIHAGDTFLNKKYPYIDHHRGGSISGLITAQKKILALSDSNTKIIPGHGLLANIADLEASISMLEVSKKLIAQLMDNNKSEDEIVKLNPLFQYHALWNRKFINTEKMTRQIYRSLVLESN
ncbi:MAG: cyclase [Phenylobacterium sp.]|jgi:cyclase